MKTKILENVRRFVCVVVAAFFLLTSCRENNSAINYTYIDSLTLANPNHAMSLLDSLAKDKDKLSEADRMQWELLNIKACDRLYRDFHTDSVILSVVSYYERHHDNRKLLDAYHFAGEVYANMNDYPSALSFYQKALELVPEDDLKTKSSISAHIGRIFTYQRLGEKALEMYRKSYSIDSVLCDTLNMIYSLADIAHSMNKLYMRDSCLAYCQKALSLARSINNNHMYNLILGQEISVYIDRGDYLKAKDLLEIVLSETDSINISPNYVKALKVYSHLGETERATYYANQLMGVGTIYAKQTAVRYLSVVALDNKDFQKSKEYIDSFYTIADSVQDIFASESVAQMSSAYNYNLRERENLQLKIKSANLRLYIVIISFACLALGLVFVYVVLRLRKKHKAQLDKIAKLKRKMFLESEEFIKENNKKIQVLEHKLSLLSEKNKTLEEKILEQKNELVIANQTALWKKNKSEAVKKRMFSSEIYAVIQKRIQSQKVLHSGEWKALHEMIQQEVEDFKISLLAYHNISEQEYRVCMLIKIGVTPSPMSYLLGCTPSAVSKVRTRLQEKFFGKSGGSKEFDEFINSL